MLQCRSVGVSYGATCALDSVDLEAAGGEIVAVMGESGSGKSTLLRAVAGLVEPQVGSVLWKGADVTGVPTYQRRFGLMFQDYALFPHLDVGENVAFGLRMRGESFASQRQTVERMLDLVGLAGYRDRPVDELSGGEQQRVALARTLAPEPDLVLLDEPLGALDRARRDQLLSDMQRIFGELGVTALYVTHDHHEAFAIADRVTVLHAGRKVADGTPAQLWRRPGHVAVATLLGFPVLYGISVTDGLGSVAGVAVEFDLPDGIHDIAVPPDAITLDPEGAFEVTVHARRFEDGKTSAVFELGGVEITAPAPAGIPLGPTRVNIDTAKLRDL